MGVKIHPPTGPSHFTSSFPSDRCNEVCFYWLAGRCNRRPCTFLHSELPNSHTATAAVASSTTKRAVHRSLTWRNPNTAGGNGQDGQVASEDPARSHMDKICSKFLAGSCSLGEKCKFLHSWLIGDGSFSLLATLHGHQKAVKGITLPLGSDKLYSAGQDEMVCVWDCHTGQCVGVNDMGSDVNCMISKGPWIFFGLTDSVKAWNTQTETGVCLDGAVGRVYALEAIDERLFAGSEDGRILDWKLTAVEGRHCFEAATSLSGHHRPVVSLVAGEGRLYSGSMDNTICIWDLTTSLCIHTLSDHTSVVMSLLCWGPFLLSGSLDGTIKAWAAKEDGTIEAVYTHSEEHGVLSLCGMQDAHEKPVLSCALNDNSVRLYDLPSFRERGKLFAKEEVRSIQIGPNGLFFTGDAAGELKVWKWLVNESAAAA